MVEFLKWENKHGKFQSKYTFWLHASDTTMGPRHNILHRSHGITKLLVGWFFQRFWLLQLGGCYEWCRGIWGRRGERFQLDQGRSSLHLIDLIFPVFVKTLGLAGEGKDGQKPGKSKSKEGVGLPGWYRCTIGRTKRVGRSWYGLKNF